MLDQEELRNVSRCLSEESRQIITMFRHLPIPKQNEFMHKLDRNVVMLINHLREIQELDKPERSSS